MRPDTEIGVAKGADQTAQRKSEHLRINLEEDVSAKGVANGFERYRFVHQALPELDRRFVDTTLTLFSRSLRAPLLISSMTGGVAEAGIFNRRLAAAAQDLGIAMGVGSQRVALADQETAATFRVRSLAPDILLFANLGAVQLNYGFGVGECQRAVEMIDADALVLHLNPLQEALQAEGNTDFSGLTAKIAAICRALPVPVIAKEVGWGISAESARMLAEAGVAAIDVAGAGGTSWSEVERLRAPVPGRARVAAQFAGWGIPTAESLVEVRRAAPDIPVFASGGIGDGLMAAKALALGATLVGIAGPALRAAAEGEDAVRDLLQETAEVIAIAMFATGCRDLDEFSRKSPLVEAAP